MKLKKFFKGIFGVLFVLAFIFSAIACGGKTIPTSKNESSTVSKNSPVETGKQSATKNKKTTNGKYNLKVSYIDVGQGDSILVQCGDKSMLIDAGPNSGEKELLKYLNSTGIKKLDYVIATHPHEDHIGGMDKVIENFKIGTMYMPKKTANTKTFKYMVQAMNKANIKPKSPIPGEKFKLGDAVCEILAPNSGEYASTNNYSIVMKLTYGKNSFLFTGDAEALSEKEILAKGFNISCDVLKLGHHGSRSSTSDAFLKKANPSCAVADCETGNDYGHPHKETVDKLKKYGIKLYRTDECKTIIAESNGKDIKFNTKCGDYAPGKRK